MDETHFCVIGDEKPFTPKDAVILSRDAFLYRGNQALVNIRRSTQERKSTVEATLLYIALNNLEEKRNQANFSEILAYIQRTIKEPVIEARGLVGKLSDDTYAAMLFDKSPYFGLPKEDQEKHSFGQISEDILGTLSSLKKIRGFENIDTNIGLLPIDFGEETPLENLLERAKLALGLFNSPCYRGTDSPVSGIQYSA